MTAYDVIIIGGGPAGLSAALVLGRCCRRVLVCDAGTPRSWAAREMHGFVTRDGIAPAEFRRIAREELSHYDNVEHWEGEVEDVARDTDHGFRVELDGLGAKRARKLLIATGVMDELPPLAGIEQFWGKSAHQCPYCDGWEIRGKPVAVYGKGRRALEMARAMTAWTSDILICSDGRCGLTSAEQEHLARNDIRLIEKRIERLSGRNGQLETIVFRGGEEIPRTALFFDMPAHSQSRLAERLGCVVTKKGGIKCGRYEATSVPGVYVAGNIIKDVQLVIVAAAEGTRAAFGINRALTRENFDRRATGVKRVEHPGPDDAEVARRRSAS